MKGLAVQDSGDGLERQTDSWVHSVQPAAHCPISQRDKACVPLELELHLPIRFNLVWVENTKDLWLGIEEMVWKDKQKVGFTQCRQQHTAQSQRERVPVIEL